MERSNRANDSGASDLREAGNKEGKPSLRGRKKKPKWRARAGVNADDTTSKPKIALVLRRRRLPAIIGS